MESIKNQITDLASKSDNAGRMEILSALRGLQCSLETPYQTQMRLYDLHFQIAMTRVGCDLGLFKTLSESETPVTVQDLANKTGAAPQLLGRILRYLASCHHIAETGTDEFTANNITRALAEPDREGGVHLSFDVCGPVTQALPDFLLETKWQNIVSNTKTAFNLAWKTTLPNFVWLRQQPQFWDYLHKALQVQHSSDWLSGFDVEKYLGNWSAQPGDEKVLFVDVGGSMGIQAAGFKRKYPHLAGTVILQDMKETVENPEIVKPIEGVEIMAQDFFKPQVIKGAKFYYHRNIFHDYPDERVLILLKNLLPALGKESLILIDEKVLPGRGVHKHATTLDIAMMAQVGSLERTKGQWYQLLENEGGCKILDIVTYTDEYDSILVVAPK
ncbi:related to O-methyltransferase [Rhynchosporium agropyri]|uniref:Related to O-methyltransferase n=1 Tax=Rhynchosporium agropyri TaxID=914238 RepID=A0A1E1L751_9HELO|nr:related to O-methyltransferase [Rhynchosporium agropyri]